MPNNAINVGVVQGHLSGRERQRPISPGNQPDAVEPASDRLSQGQAPEPRGDMAVMLEDIERARQSLVAGSSGPNKPATPEGPEHEPDLVAGEPSEHHHAHHHEKHKHAAVGGHLGNEAVHMAGHHAAHAAAQVSAKLGAASVDASDALHTVQDTAQHDGGLIAGGVHAASGLTPLLRAAVETGAVASLGIGGFMAYVGVKELRAAAAQTREGKGTKGKRAELALEGVGSLAVGARSLAAAVALGGIACPALAVAGKVAARALPVLGVVHGTTDMVLGVQTIRDGQKLKGALELAFGAAVTAASVGGGAPALILAGVALAGKITYEIASGRAKKTG